LNRFSEQVPEPSTSLSAVDDYAQSSLSGASISFESPKEKSSPIYEYVSRMPTYRRRSIHPDRPGLDSPYTDFMLPETRSTVSSTGYYKQSKYHKPMGSYSVKSSIGVRSVNWLRIPFSLTLSFVGALWYTVTSGFRRLKSSSALGHISFRLIACLFLVGLLVLLVTKLLYGDPFYHNPVNDLRGWMQRRRA
uniref:DUF4190 domain-containing protein n=1 Tax=Echinostoma caproni TaxID=27848 RepID=A0A183B7M1_9TREM